MALLPPLVNARYAAHDQVPSYRCVVDVVRMAHGSRLAPRYLPCGEAAADAAVVHGLYLPRQQRRRFPNCDSKSLCQGTFSDLFRPKIPKI